MKAYPKHIASTMDDDNFHSVVGHVRPIHRYPAGSRSGGRHLARIIAPACRLVIGAAALLLSTQAALAQDLEPRRYVNIPVDQNFLRMAAGYSWGEVNISPAIQLTDADLSTWGASLAYLRTIDIGGRASSFDVFLPYLCADGSAVREGNRQSRNVCGLGDARVRFTYNFIGAQALDIGEFVRRKREFVVGTSVQVYVPTGQYDADRLLNIGANRWVLRPEIGLSVPFDRWNIEFSAGARFFQDNDQFLGDSTSAQDPLYNLQVHAVYDLSPRQWLSMNGNYFFGGETFRDGNPTQLRQENSRLGLTWHIAADTFNMFQLTASWGVITRVGNDSTTLSIAWLRRWE